MFSYDTLKQTKFLGIFGSIDDVPTSGLVTGNTVLIGADKVNTSGRRRNRNNLFIPDFSLYYYDSDWYEITFLGTYDTYSGATPNNYDLIYLYQDNKYQIYLNGSWEDFDDENVFILDVLKVSDNE